MVLVLESGAALIENAPYALPAGPSGQVGMADTAAGGQRREELIVTTRANNVADFRGAGHSINLHSVLLEPPQRGPRFG